LLLGVLVSLTIFGLAGELLARQLDLIDRLNGFPRELYLATAIADLPYRLRPGITARSSDVPVRVNALGLRGPEVAAAPAPGTRRLLVLGDSVVFGEGLAEEDTFPRLLERALAEAGAAPTEVLNGAAPGYNTEAELAYLREVGLALAPDELVLGVSLNDFGPTPALTPSGFLTVDPKARDRAPWPSNHSEFYVLLRWTITYARGGHWYQRVVRAGPAPPAAPAPPADAGAAFDRAIAVMHKRFYARPTGEGWERVQRALAGFRDLTRARGLPLTLIIFPERDQVEDATPNLDPQRQWLALCTSLELRCLDLHPAFAAARDGSLFADTQHPNAAGLRIAAGAVADFVTRPAPSARVRPQSTASTTSSPNELATVSAGGKVSHARRPAPSSWSRRRSTQPRPVSLHRTASAAGSGSRAAASIRRMWLSGA
jgi:lysophospholipase L1-like esterase